MSEPSSQSSNQNDMFLKAFVPGLVLGLVIGALAGALIPPFLSSSEDRPGPVAGTGVTNEQRTQMRDDDRDGEGAVNERDLEDAATDPAATDPAAADPASGDNPASGG